MVTFRLYTPTHRRLKRLHMQALLLYSNVSVYMFMWVCVCACACVCTLCTQYVLVGVCVCVCVFVCVYVCVPQPHLDDPFATPSGLGILMFPPTWLSNRLASICVCVCVCLCAETQATHNTDRVKEHYWNCMHPGRKTRCPFICGCLRDKRQMSPHYTTLTVCLEVGT
jgi:hypothetical protein